MFFLVFVSRDFELGRTWLAGGVNCQFCAGLIFALSHLILLLAAAVAIAAVKAFVQYKC